VEEISTVLSYHQLHNANYGLLTLVAATCNRRRHNFVIMVKR